LTQEFLQRVEFQEGLQQYLNAMELEVESVTISVETKMIINGNKYSFVVATPNQAVLSPEQQKYLDLYVSVPLFVYLNEDGQSTFVPFTPSLLASQTGIYIGTIGRPKTVRGAGLAHQVREDTFDSFFTITNVWENREKTRGSLQLELCARSVGPGI